MQHYKLQYAKEASKDLLKMDRNVARRIVQKLESHCDSENPIKHAKPLTGNLSGLLRYRIGDYRAIFEVDTKGVITILTILTIKHRKDVYRTDI